MSLQITTMQLEREKALEHKNRMTRMLEDRDLFVTRLKAARQSVYEVSFVVSGKLFTSNCFVLTNFFFVLTNSLVSGHTQLCLGLAFGA